MYLFNSVEFAKRNAISPFGWCTTQLKPSALCKTDWNRNWSLVDSPQNRFSMYWLINCMLYVFLFWCLFLTNVSACNFLNNVIMFQIVIFRILYFHVKSISFGSKKWDKLNFEQYSWSFLCIYGLWPPSPHYSIYGKH